MPLRFYKLKQKRTCYIHFLVSFSELEVAQLVERQAVMESSLRGYL